jgi:CRISPR-associated protein Csd1
MLHALKAYAAREKIITPPGFTSKQVKWCLVFTTTGQFQTVMPLGDVENKRNRGRTFNMSPNLSFSEMKAGGIAKSHFLLDALDSIIPYGKDAEDPKKAEKREYFVNLLRMANASYPGLANVAKTLSDGTVLDSIANKQVAPHAGAWIETHRFAYLP